jgi:RND family efflux transporter MFP subunit
VVVTQWNDSTELFLEYPHPVAGEHTGNWAIHLTDLSEFEPIRSGVLTVRFTPDPSSSGGAGETFTVGAPARDGIFLLDPLVTRAGTYSVTLELVSPQAVSRHDLPAVRVHASLDEAPREEEGAADGGIAFLKEQQWVIPFAVAAAEEREVRRSVTAPAEIVPPDGALFHVSAPVSGIAPAEANRDAPSVGQRVEAGDVLAVLAPTTDEGGFADVRARVERLEREVERSERLYAAGAVPLRRLEDARRELGVAQAELEAMGGDGGDGDFLLRLRAPITGVIAERDFVPGGRVAAGLPLFTVVDPGTAWLRVQLPTGPAATLTPGGRARFTVEGSGVVHETARLLSIGSVLDPRTRTVPVVYEAGQAGGRLTFGQMATAYVPVGEVERGVAIPESAVLDENGTPVAYVQTGGESFERRVLTEGASDGAFVLARGGVSAGEWVVVTGAYQVRLAGLSGNEFAGGHAH